jgi:hypothetical protein
MNGKNNINVASGGDSSDDFVSVKGRDDTHFEDERTSVSGGARGTYPADCYSFMAVHGPFDGTHYFYFGFLVWVFQVRSDDEVMNSKFKSHLCMNIRYIHH